MREYLVALVKDGITIKYRLFKNGYGLYTLYNFETVDLNYMIAHEDRIANIKIEGRKVVGVFRDLSCYPVINQYGVVVANKNAAVVIGELSVQELYYSTKYTLVIGGKEVEEFSKLRLKIQLQNGLEVLNGIITSDYDYISNDTYAIHTYKITQPARVIYERDRFEIGNYTYQYNGVYTGRRNSRTQKPEFEYKDMDGWGVAITDITKYNANEKLVDKPFGVPITSIQGLFSNLKLDKISFDLGIPLTDLLHCNIVSYAECNVIDISNLSIEEALEIFLRNTIYAAILVVSKQVYLEIEKIVKNGDAESIMNTDDGNGPVLKVLKDKEQLDKTITKAQFLDTRGLVLCVDG